MPHGVRFRGGKEKLIREIFLEDDVMEAIIGLPPNLFYCTGIPACVFVVNKNKLRPEDIEKIDYVFTNKLTGAPCPSARAR
jgi:type I restriction enzyme M protein